MLELVEGPTLADRISQGPIPLDVASRLGGVAVEQFPYRRIGKTINSTRGHLFAHPMKVRIVLALSSRTHMSHAGVVPSQLERAKSPASEAVRLRPALGTA